MLHKKQFYRMIAMVLIMPTILLSGITSYAAEKTVKIYTLEDKQDLTVMFSFDKEVVDITFISPDGSKLTKADKSMSYDSGELWSSYTIEQAAKGDWSITYDLGTNKNINYSIVENTSDEAATDNSAGTKTGQSATGKSMIDEGLSSNSSGSNETEISIQKIKPVEETQTSSNEGSTESATTKKKSSAESKWVINEGDPRTTVIETYVGSGTTRFEVFYSASALTPPEVTFMSASGNIYRKDSDVEYGNTVFITRSGYVVSDYPDIKYDIIYIKGAEDPGTWKMSVSIDDHTNELFVVTSKVPDGWEHFQTDYKTAPTDALLWYINPKLSSYTVNDITSVIAKDTDIPETNSIQPYVDEEVPEQKNPIVGVLILLSLAIIGGIAAIIFLYKKSQKESVSNRKNAIARANKKLKAKQKKENNSLDQVLANYEDEYRDDEAIFASFNKKLTENTEKPKQSSQPSNPNEIKRKSAESAKVPQRSAKAEGERRMSTVPENESVSRQIAEFAEEKMDVNLPTFKEMEKEDIKIPSWVDKSSMLDENSPAWKKQEEVAITNFF